jgi:carbonic anhydrase
VLGHTSCGAVTAAVRGGEENGHIGSVLCEICEAVDNSCSGEEGEEEKVSAAVRENALLIAGRLRSSEPVLKKLVDGGSLLVAAALYDIESGKVTLITSEGQGGK